MEESLKKKLNSFIAEMTRVGTVKGFKYFAMYIRGREELMISVLNEPLELQYTPLTLSTASDISWSPATSFNSANLPYDKRSLMLSQRSQKQLSGYGNVGIGLPPASPSEHETMETDENSTLFLLASYARYHCPYVWVRSNHMRLVQSDKLKANEKDSPLKLKTTNNWQKHDVKPWDMIAELIKLNTYPPPTNPFTVDFEYFESISERELLAASAAMMQFLQNVIIHAPENKYYTAKVMEDLERLTKLHVEHLVKMTHDHSSPLAQRLAPTSPGSQEDIGRRRRTSSSGSRYPPEAYQVYG